MRHRQAALDHHLHKVSQTQLKAKIPAHAQDDDVAVGVATLEQLFYSLQFGHCRPRLVQHATVADRTVPFAPEPYLLCFGHAATRHLPHSFHRAALPNWALVEAQTRSWVGAWQ